MKKYKYPNAAQQLLDGDLMPDADWLTAEMRRDIADDVRLLRNAIAASVGSKNLRQRPTSDRFEQSSAYGGGHDRGDSLLVNWFRENRDLAGPSGLLLPTFEQADRALKAVLLPPGDDGKQQPRYEKMSAERRRAYGIPDGYLTPEKLNALAWQVGLPPGYLLLQLRVDRVLSGRKWEAAPIREWLRDAIGFQLRQLGVEPYAPELTPEPTPRTTPDQATLIQQPKATSTKMAPTTELDPKKGAARDAVMRLRAIRTQLGGNDELFALFGDRRGFNQAFAAGAGKQTNRALTWEKLEQYLKFDYEGQSAAMVNSSTRLPNVTHTKAMVRIIDALDEFLPEPGVELTGAHRVAAKAAIGRAFEPPATLFDATGKKPKTEDDPGAPGGLK